MKVFFTYVWGNTTEPAWPLSFRDKASRRHALNELSSGDFVFTVGTKNEPTAVEDRGLVLGAYNVSDIEVNTQDYPLRFQAFNFDDDGAFKFPYALHPLEVWSVDEPGAVFSEIVGPLKPSDHLQAQTRVVELEDEVAIEKLLKLSRHRVEAAFPSSALGLGKLKERLQKQAPKHSGDYAGAFEDHDTWYVYTLVLRNSRRQVLAVKVGYSHNPKKREADYNLKMASEVTELTWERDFSQPFSTEDDAREVEQAVLKKFDHLRLYSNGEVLEKIDPIEVATAIGMAARDTLSNDVSA